MHYLIDHGYTDRTRLDGITITSRKKNSRGKRYYAKDKLAFIAWDNLGFTVEDKDFLKWKNLKRGRRKMNG